MSVQFSLAKFRSVTVCRSMHAFNISFTRSSKHRAKVEQMYSKYTCYCSTSAWRLLDIICMFKLPVFNVFNLL